MNRNVISQVFEETVFKQPDRVALVSSKGTWTFLQLFRRAADYAAAIGTDCARAGVVMDHGFEQIAALFGIERNGAAFINAEPFLPDWRIAAMMEDGKADVIVTDDPGRFADFGFRIIDSNNVLPAKENGDLPILQKPEDIAYILFTSGTTGRPKGIQVTSANVCHYARAFDHEFHVKSCDRMLQYSVSSFDIFIEEVFASLLNGASLAIPDAQEKETVSALLDFVGNQAVTMISGFPYLLEKINRLKKEGRDLPPSLRLLISGGDVLRKTHCDALYKLLPVYNTYGPSETTVCASYFLCTPDSALDDGTFPIGTPVLETGIEILDSNRIPAKQGETGEICIFGQGVSSGYTNGSDEEKSRFCQDRKGRKMYQSGDLGYQLSDGTIVFVGRKDDQVMIEGRRVEPGEVESALLAIPEIEQAAVRSAIDEDSMPYLTGYLVFKDQPLSDRMLRNELAKRLPDFMIPEYFVAMPSLGRTVNGKIDRSLLPVILKKRKKYE